MLKRLKYLENKLQSKYQSIEIQGNHCFITNKDEIIHLTGLKNFRAIVIEYAETLEEAKRNLFEDGDLFYIDELTEDEMLNKMIKEIENVD